MKFEDMLQTSPYSLDKEEKGRFLTERLESLQKNTEKAAPSTETCWKAQAMTARSFAAIKSFRFFRCASLKSWNCEAFRRKKW